MAATPVGANGWLSLFERSCVVGTAAHTPYPGQKLTQGEASCNAPGVEGSAPRTWLRRSLDGSELPAGALAIVFKPVLIDAMTVREEFTDGRIVERRYPATKLMDDWLPGARGELPLVGTREELRAIAVAVDGPAGGPALETLELGSAKAVDVRRDRLFLLYGFFIAITLLPLLYDGVFLAVLRERFILWHAAAVPSVVLFLVSSGGMLMLFAPDMPIVTQWRLSIVGFVLAGVFTIGFTGSFLGSDTLSRPVMWGLRGTSGLLLASGAGVILASDVLLPLAVSVYFASFIPAMAALVLALAQGLQRDARAGRFMTIAWLAVFATGVWSILDAFNVVGGPGDENDRMPYGIIAMTLVSAVGVADRFMLLRRDRDQQERARNEFARLADTDLLTGLGNRRRLEAEWAEQDFDATLVVDLDNFKSVNDDYGHDTGDAVIRAAAIALSGTHEEKLRVYRWGGEEFVIGIHARNAEEATLLAQAARQAVEVRIAERVPQIEVPLTASAGLARADGERTFTDSFRAADAALLEAKRAGRNRLWVADDPLKAKGGPAPVRRKAGGRLSARAAPVS